MDATDLYAVQQAVSQLTTELIGFVKYVNEEMERIHQRLAALEASNTAAPSRKKS